jgi:hypothetical protein
MPQPDKVLGCGNYGCVFETSKQNIALKFTTNADEAVFFNFQKEAKISGIVNIRFVLNVNRSGFLIWRDRLDTCCYDAIKSLLIEHGIPDTNYRNRDLNWNLCEYGAAFEFYESSIYTRSKRKIQKQCENIASIPGLRDIGNGLYELSEMNMALSDIHAKNVGRFQNYDQLIIFDAESEFYDNTTDSLEWPQVSESLLNQYPIQTV